MTEKRSRPGETGAASTTGQVDTHKDNPNVMLAAAVEYAQHNWEVLPLRGKSPAIPKHRGGKGVLDATTDLDQITVWWSRYHGANIGGRVPESMFVLDVDPRYGGLDTITKLQNEHGPMPETLTTISGRGDGGFHLFYRRPPGALTAKNLGAGIDVKTHSGYVVLSPSIHPDSGKPYICIDHPVAAPARWLVDLLIPKTAHTITPGRTRTSFSGHLSGSVADDFSASTSWTEILEPHHWTCSSGDPDADGAVWLHPAHTSACSATVRHGCLFVWSTSTVFDASEPGRPRGYTRFHAHAVLNHGGNMSAAARALRAVST